MLVDSHCHLDYPDFEAEGIPEIILRAKAAGVGHFLTICTHISQFDRILATAEKSPLIHCTVGTHPHHAAEAGEIEVKREEIVALTKHSKVVGIGECGLDYHYNHSPPAEQQKVFATHVEASVESGLPLVIHTREAEDDTVRILKDVGQGKAKGVMHCFSSSMDLAMKSLDIGFYISFSGIITFKKSEELRDVVRRVPLERMLVETDCPYLAPEPYRGKRCEPAFTAITAQKVAELKNVSLQEVMDKTTQNFFALFSKAKIS